MKENDKPLSVGPMLLTDLSKAFDRLRHDWLIAKLAAYGFDQPSLCFIFSYISGRTQRTKVNNAYDSYTDIKCGVAQGVAQVLHKVLYYALFFSISIFVIFLGQWWGGIL